MGVRPFLPAVAALVLAAVLPCQGWAGRRTEIRIYDPTGRVRTQLNASDIVRSSARALRGVGGSGAWLYFAFTKTGDAKFRALIRALSHRGGVLHRQQYLAFAIDGHVYSRGRIDDKEFPNGLVGDSGFELQDLSLTLARRLAGLIRAG